MRPLISIVVPVFNVRQYIEETIHSIQAQSYKEWELILVDDGSTDGTREYLETINNPRIRVIFLKENIGAAKARNKGVAEAKGKYVSFMDADDLWVPEKLEKQVEFMENRNINFSFTSYEFGTEEGKPTGHIVKVPEEITYKKALKNTTIFTSTVMLNIEILGKDMVQMPEIKSEDTATWWKILRLGISAYGINENLVIYRRPKKSLSSNKWEALKRIWYLYRKQEKIGRLESMFYFSCWAFHAVMRRI